MPETCSATRWLNRSLARAALSTLLDSFNLVFAARVVFWPAVGNILPNASLCCFPCYHRRRAPKLIPVFLRLRPILDLAVYAAGYPETDPVIQTQISAQWKSTSSSIHLLEFPRLNV
jgi:hypothetical protein